jgi:hypothetical protein
MDELQRALPKARTVGKMWMRVEHLHKEFKRLNRFKATR